MSAITFGDLTKCDKSGNFEATLQDRDLIDECNLHLEEMSNDDEYSPVRKVLRKVCQKLNDFCWEGILATTDDSRCRLVDNTCGRPHKQDIKASISEERFADLTTGGGG